MTDLNDNQEVNVKSMRGWLIGGLVFLQACSTSQVLTEDQRARQDKVDGIVAGILFENDLDTLAAYNVGLDGYVKINFHPSAQFLNYDKAVRELRANPEVKGVYAEQSGGEVCPMKPLGR